MAKFFCQSGYWGYVARVREGRRWTIAQGPSVDALTSSCFFAPSAAEHDRVDFPVVRATFSMIM